VRAAVLATLVLLALYALLPEHYRFSRGILVFGALLAFACMSALRWLLTKAGLLPKVPFRSSKPYLLVAGSVAEYAEIKNLLGQRSRSVIGRIAVTEDHGPKIAALSQVDATAAALNAQEVVLCSGTASNKDLIQFVQKLKHRLRLRFHAAGSGSIVGSDSSTASGEVVSATVAFNLAQPVHRRVKRLIDVATALLFLLFFPLHFLLVPNPVRLLGNAVQVLAGRKTWIGYAVQAAPLPRLRPAALTADGMPVHGVLKKSGDPHFPIDFWYARNWEPLQDIKLIFKNYQRLGTLG
jgi:hypothetical protein